MRKIDPMENIIKAMEFMRKHPGDRIPYISKEDNDKYDMYVAAKRDADDELADKLEKEISSSPCWFLIDMYYELDEKRRKKYNEGKPTLVQIFNDWADGKIDDNKARRLYNQIELYKVKYDETDQYTNDGPIHYVGDNNSLFELNYEIRERFGIDDKDDMGVKFKRVIGMIADPNAEPLVIGKLKFVNDENGDLQVVGRVDEDNVESGEIPFGTDLDSQDDEGFEFYNDYYTGSKTGSKKVKFEGEFFDPDYIPGSDDDSFYAPEPLDFDSNEYYNDNDYAFRDRIRDGIKKELVRLLEEDGRDCSSLYESDSLNMALDLLSEMALVAFKHDGGFPFTDENYIIKYGAKRAFDVLDKYKIIKTI